MKFSRYSGNPSFVLGFHGCDASVAEKVFAGEAKLEESINSYDWLGNGIYFWENNPERAWEWAQSNKKISTPAVVGAVIDLGFTLSLLQRDHISLVEEAYNFHREAYEGADIPRPTNRGGPDAVIRELDCAVIETLHWSRREGEEQKPPFDTVRGLFPEGKPLYECAGFRKENHIQVCVRNSDCIKGYFRPLGD